MEGGDAARALAVVAAGIIYAFRIGCFLHVLHLAVNAGMENVFFMGRLGSGSWHEWAKQHLVCFLGSAYGLRLSKILFSISLTMSMSCSSVGLVSGGTGESLLLDRLAAAAAAAAAVRVSIFARWRLFCCRERQHGWWRRKSAAGKYLDAYQICNFVLVFYVLLV